MTRLIHLSDLPELHPLLDDENLAQIEGFDLNAPLSVLHDSQQTMVLSPKENKRVVIKISKYPMTVSPDQEYDLVNKFHRAHSSLFTCPNAIIFSIPHQYLAMSRLNKPLSLTKKVETLTDDEAQKIGHAFGSFSVEADKGGLVHTDFHLGNVTEEKEGKIGILDFSALVKTNIERMLASPIMTNERLAFSIAKTFCEGTGKRFKLSSLKTEGMYLLAKVHNNPGFTKETIARHETVFHNFMKRAKAYPRYFR